MGSFFWLFPDEVIYFWGHCGGRVSVLSTINPYGGGLNISIKLVTRYENDIISKGL
jgi:hypothetical protein